MASTGSAFGNAHSVKLRSCSSSLSSTPFNPESVTRTRAGRSRTCTGTRPAKPFCRDTRTFTSAVCPVSSSTTFVSAVINMSGFGARAINFVRSSGLATCAISRAPIRARPVTSKRTAPSSFASALAVSRRVAEFWPAAIVFRAADSPSGNAPSDMSIASSCSHRAAARHRERHRSAAGDVGIARRDAEPKVGPRLAQVQTIGICVAAEPRTSRMRAM